ncbi:MAG: heme lyase CcmF/NrfE family subunit [Caulobacter sp.]
MIAEVGRFCLILALIITSVQVVAGLWGARRQNAQLMTITTSAAVAQFIFIALAFALLVWLFVVSDFSVMVVAANSATIKPMFYKITSTWGNHEGSMLLWVLILAFFGAAIGMFGRNMPAPFKARVLGVQGLISLGFLAFIIFTSSPFARLFPVPVEGAGFNPLLQDPGLAAHPPLLYLGYVGFSTAFSFAIAALIEGRSDTVWVRYARPWIIIAWICLTIGITLGSLWAYYELGWGGWWFWDPVENASLMPWLLGTALVHSALVVERRFALVRWTILLGILTFSMSLLGTFVVRSGILTSVHAFAVDPARGAFILVLLVLATGGGLALYAIRSPVLGAGRVFSLVSREGSLVLNNILLVTVTGTVFLGTFYPLLIDLLTEDKISVGAPFYAMTFVPMAAPLLLVMVIGPMLSWRRDSGQGLLGRLAPALFVGFTVLVLVAAGTHGAKVIAALWLAMAAWIVVGSLMILVRRTRVGQVSLPESLTLLKALPPATFGLVLAHAGIGMLVAGLAGGALFKQEGVAMLGAGQSVPFIGRTLTLTGVQPGREANYEFVRGRIEIRRGAGKPGLLFPERRFYPERQSDTTEAGVRVTPLGNLYVALGDQAEDGRWTIRYYSHPLAVWIWLGGGVMALGGGVALFDRRNWLTPERQPAREVQTSGSAPA